MCPAAKSHLGADKRTYRKLERAWREQAKQWTRYNLRVSVYPCPPEQRYHYHLTTDWSDEQLELQVWGNSQLAIRVRRELGVKHPGSHSRET